MCRIAVKKGKDFTTKMSHGGTQDHFEYMANQDITLKHNWLPIQTNGIGSPIINGHILFNGEIFDHLFNDDMELIATLDKQDDLLTYLSNIKSDGFWSIIDVQNNYIFVYTDPLGKKQLYYKEGYGIASELKELVEPNEPMDKLFESHTIKFGYVTDDRTPYTNIKRIMPNITYVFNMDLKLYHVDTKLNTLITPKRLSPDEFIDAMDKAVKDRLIGHESIGLLLSGGLDSSIIKHHIGDNNVTSYCVDNIEDLKYAKLMDNNVKIIPTLKQHKQEALKTMEMPLDLGSMIPQYSLIGAVDETVILTGDGADEIFGGYKRMLTYDSQYSDIFDELPFYHNIRLDRMAAIHTKEIRSPFMNLDIVRHGLSLTYEERKDKSWLRDIYKDLLPHDIVHRPKEPLKTDVIRKVDPVVYRKQLIKDFYESI